MTAQGVAAAAAQLPEDEILFSDGNSRGERKETPDAPPNVHLLPYLPRYALVYHHSGTGVMFHTL